MRKLSEVKEIMKTEKVFETATAFGVNDFGKYRPNITFIIRKDFEGNPLTYRSDSVVKSMIDNMNIDFNGTSPSVMFGDFWTSRKGGACFRPKQVATAQHVLVRVNWGGAFCDTRGSCGGAGELYFRRAASNGGGTGYDYWVFPLGFYRILSDTDIDGEVQESAPDFSERAQAIRGRFAELEREQTAKEQAKADAEETSREAKDGFLSRLEDVNSRLVAIGQKSVELGDTTFKWGWRNHLYTEERIAELERQVEELESQFSEKERKRLIREEFEAKFQAFGERAASLGLEISFSEDRVNLIKDGRVQGYGQPYSEEGLPAFAKELRKLEAKAAEARAKAEAEARYNVLRQQGQEAGLPQDIRIWRRRGGRTDAGCGWVIGADGRDREPTGMYNSNPRRLQRYHEGDMIWEQIIPGEVVLKWSKASSAAPHCFEVIHLPEGELTEEQLERIAEIQDELEREWEGACGLASGIPSPPVGDGWGVLPNKAYQPAASQVEVEAEEQPEEPTPPSENSVAALLAKFGRK